MNLNKKKLFSPIHLEGKINLGSLIISCLFILLLTQIQFHYNLEYFMNMGFVLYYIISYKVYDIIKTIETYQNKINYKTWKKEFPKELKRKIRFWLIFYIGLSSLFFFSNIYLFLSNITYIYLIHVLVVIFFYYKISLSLKHIIFNEN